MAGAGAVSEPMSFSTEAGHERFLTRRSLDELTHQFYIKAAISPLSFKPLMPSYRAKRRKCQHRPPLTQNGWRSMDPGHFNQFVYALESNPIDAATLNPLYTNWARQRAKKRALFHQTAESRSLSSSSFGLLLLNVPETYLGGAAGRRILSGRGCVNQEHWRARQGTWIPSTGCRSLILDPKIVGCQARKVVMVLLGRSLIGSDPRTNTGWAFQDRDQCTRFHMTNPTPSRTARAATRNLWRPLSAWVQSTPGFNSPLPGTIVANLI
uniref:Uncharacterized protein n=1 Tax=Coccidioides posadasii RMSCC 3488 TaxID=454284 RepID=A0A0J6FMF9_COCPO|nr:hypothetical protein CPAG_06386 [Coccidioides posadasii RMSCC 3488]